MSIIIKTLTLPMPFRMGSVNCYLLDTGSGYILIDTGSSYNRKQLVLELGKTACQPGDLKLIVITHGDFDHTGNAASLRQVHGVKIAMHADDAGMAENGDMFFNRQKPHFLIRTLVSLFTGFGKSERFTPDLLLADGDNLSEFGLEAEVLSIPGHSKGSIGFLVKNGAFFCGDLLTNTDKPSLSTLMDDLAAANVSLQKMGKYPIRTVYPGHGEPFPFSAVWANIPTVD